MEKKLKAVVPVEIGVPAPKVWEALVTPSQIKKYLHGTEAESDWKPGSPLVFTGEWKGKTYQDKGTILENEQGKRLKYSWWSSMSGLEDREENYSVITYDLDPRGDSTLLTLTQENIADEKSKAGSESNWRAVLEDLKKMLEDSVD